MIIIKQSRKQLILVEVPWGVWLLVFIFLVVPTWLVLIMNNVGDKFICQRFEENEGTCTLIKSNTGLSEVSIRQQISLNDLGKAHFSKVKALKNRSYYISFSNKRGYYLTQGSHRKYPTNKEFMVSQINDFLNNPAHSSLLVEEQPPLLLINICMSIFVVAFFLLACFGRIKFYSFDKNKDEFKVTWIGLLGFQVIRYSLSFIRDIKLIPNNIGSDFLGLFIVLNSDKKFFVNSYPITERKAANQFVKALKNFLS